MKWENVVIAINYDLESFIAMKLEMTLIIKINMMLILLRFFINYDYSVYITWYLTLLYIFFSWTSALTKRQRCSSILPLNPWTWTSSSRQTRPWQNQATIRKLHSNPPPCSNPTLLLDHQVYFLPITSPVIKVLQPTILSFITLSIAFRKHEPCYW